jgi:hypothetical protein
MIGKVLDNSFFKVNYTKMVVRTKQDIVPVYHALAAPNKEGDVLLFFGIIICKGITMSQVKFLPRIQIFY